MTRAALDAWLTEHFSDTWRIAVRSVQRLTGCTREEAEDCTAEVLRRVLASGNHGQPVSRSLFVIAAQRERIAQERKHRPLPLGALADDGERLDLGAPERGYEQAELVALVTAGLAAMTDEQRRVVLLDYAGCSLDETAERTGQSVAAIKKLRVRGRATARRATAV